MKKVFLIILVLCSTFSVVAQQYDTVWSATKVVLYCRKSKFFPLYFCNYTTFTNFSPMQYGDSTLAP